MYYDTSYTSPFLVKIGSLVMCFHPKLNSKFKKCIKLALTSLLNHFLKFFIILVFLCHEYKYYRIGFIQQCIFYDPNVGIKSSTQKLVQILLLTCKYYRFDQIA
jgi:hypothetical protein